MGTANTTTPKAAKTPAPKAAKTPAPKAAKTPAPKAAKTPAPKAAKTPAPKAAKTPAPKAAKVKDDSGGVSNKDLKLLWGRAAARCAFAECRQLLTEKSGTTTWGNVCHIVAEAAAGPRGKSLLSKAERNAFSNLLLLCSHHHDVIDKLPAGPKNFPIEVLHKIKAEHELWVEENLAAQANAADLAYSRIVDDITMALRLDQWDWFSDAAIRDILTLDALEAAQLLRMRLLQIVWPGKYTALDDSAKATMKAFIGYVEHFETFCEPAPNNAEFLQANLAFKRRYPNPQYHHWAERRDIWSHLNCVYLCRVVLALNDYAEAVRGSINPRYFAAAGWFLVNDSMNYRGEGGPFLPEKKRVNRWAALWEGKLADWHARDPSATVTAT